MVLVSLWSEDREVLDYPTVVISFFVRFGSGIFEQYAWTLLELVVQCQFEGFSLSHS